MCHTQNHPMKTTKPTSKPKPARKTRTKTRKPKFLSLSMSMSLSMSLEQQLSPETTQMTNPQLTLFPLHPENLFEEKESNDNNVAYLLEQEGGGGATLNGLLGGTGTSEDSQSLSPSLLTYAYGGQDKDSEGASTLAQAALRQKKELDVSEEKWVLYSDVVEENKEEEISSYSYNRQQEFGLSLKLDYQEILNAWSDKGSLYIGEDKEEECPQTVPDQPQDDDTSTTDGYTDVGCMANMRLWNVPEGGSNIIEDGGEGKMGRREAKVLRYKEKRQSRLFSKRIRYQVRKLNAEKRPRMKGRFVKRKAEV